MKQHIYCSLHSVVSLMSGGVLYLALRSETYLNKWFFFCEPLVLSQTRFGRAVGMYVPDFLWGYSLAMALYAVCSPKQQAQCIPAVMAAMCGIGWELLQACGFVSGTGDMVDGILYVLAAVVSNSMYRKRMEEK